MILCILKGEMPFKMHKNFNILQKKNNLKICLPNLSKFSDLLPEKHLFYYLALEEIFAFY